MATPATEINEVPTDDIRLDADNISDNDDICKDLNNIRLNYHDLTKNFDSWLVDMENYLRSGDLLGIIDGSEPRPSYSGNGSREHDSWCSKDDEAHQIIKEACDPKIPSSVEFCSSAAQAWTNIRSQ
ncbi:hypothetical protein MKX03_034940, partial [Papaver bracteatum]